MSPHADLSVPEEEQEGYCSLLIFRGESLESVRKMVEADPFYVEGVVSAGTSFRSAMTDYVLRIRWPSGTRRS